MSVEATFQAYSAAKLSQLMGRVETCVNQLTPEQLWLRHSENENATANLLLHLAGNVRQWILHGVDGQPDQRQRDAEFAAQGGTSAADLLAALRKTVDEAVEIIRALPPGRLLDSIRPQGYDVTVLEAIFHVVEHFAGHTFQIILLTKQYTGKDLGFHARLSGRGKHNDRMP